MRSILGRILRILILIVEFVLRKMTLQRLTFNTLDLLLQRLEDKVRWSCALQRVLLFLQIILATRMCF